MWCGKFTYAVVPRYESIGYNKSHLLSRRGESDKDSGAICNENSLSRVKGVYFKFHIEEGGNYVLRKVP